MLIQQAREKISTGKMHEGYPGCTSASYFSFFFFFHPGFLVSCTQQIHLAKSAFQNQGCSILSILKTSYPKPQRELVTVPGAKLKQSQYFSEI